jgi:hypothetical protein
MAINYTWDFPKLTVVYNKDTLVNVISVSHWKLTATEDDISFSSYGSVSLDAPNPASFTSYDEVNKGQIQQWTEQAIGDETLQYIKDALEKRINDAKVPKQSDMNPPW